MERIETLVIGAGQAGLAVSYHLTQLGREHLVLERGRIAETWRSKRWDGFYLNTPNWAQQLPGFSYQGPEPDAFPPLAEVIAYLEDYATSIHAPVREGVCVTAVRPHRSGGYELETDGAALQAGAVVVAAGAYQHPTPSLPASAVRADVFQLHTSEYRRPEQLPDGAVLVVGSGQSGCQIADELIEAGRIVYLAVGRCPWLPRRYRGREIVHWLIDVGLADQTVDTLPTPAARLACNPPVSGNDGGHDCHPRWLARRGAILVGRVRQIDRERVTFEPGLAEALAKGDEFVAELRRRIDEYVAAEQLDLPEEPPEGPPAEVPETQELDLGHAGITTILWATGYRPDLSWIELDVADELGWPVQRRGVTAHLGLYFVGVHWLHKRKSSLFLGVGEDAEYVAAHLDGST